MVSRSRVENAKRAGDQVERCLGNVRDFELCRRPVARFFSEGSTSTTSTSSFVAFRRRQSDLLRNLNAAPLRSATAGWLASWQRIGGLDVIVSANVQVPHLELLVDAPIRPESARAGGRDNDLFSPHRPSSARSICSRCQTERTSVPAAAFPAATAIEVVCSLGTCWGGWF